MASTTPLHIQLKHRCREVQGGQTHASIYRAQQRWQKHENRLNYIKGYENRASTTLQKMRARHMRTCWTRDASYVKRHARRERAEADRVPLPVKAVQTVMYFASEDVIDTCNFLSLLPEEVGERLARLVIG
jgi:hypothetical protein